MLCRAFSLLSLRLWARAVTWHCCGSTSPAESTQTGWSMSRTCSSSGSSRWRLCMNALRCNAQFNKQCKQLQCRPTTWIFFQFSSRIWRTERWWNSPSYIATLPRRERKRSTLLSATGLRSGPSSPMPLRATMSSTRPWIWCCLKMQCSTCKCLKYWLFVF